MAEFAGQVIIITGASEGIGRALCLALAPQRPRLVLAARNKDRLNELAQECEQAGAEALVVPTDVTDRAPCRNLIDQAVESFGRIDVLVNNAGRTMWARFDEITDTSVFESVMDVNYFGAVWATYFALPHLKKTKGCIVAIASLTGLTGVPCRTAYAASKHALIGFFDSLRIELAGSGVTVTIVAPDFVVSETHRRALDAHGQPLGTSPMQEHRIMTAETCAGLIVKAMEKRQRLLVLSARGKLGRWLKLVAPGIIDRIAARAIEQRK